MNKKQQRDAKLKRQQELVNAARAANRALSDSEQAEFDTLQRDIDALNAEIEAAERQQQTPPPAPDGEPESGSRSEPEAGADDQQRTLQQERTRVTEITALCREFDVDPTAYITGGNSMDQVRAAILNQLRGTHAPVTASAKITGSGEDDFRRDAADGLLIRGGVELEKPSAGARTFTNMTLRDLAIECLEREGVTGARRMSTDDILREVHSRAYFNPTSAFPTILDNAIEKAYVEGHRTVPVTFDRWTRRGSLKDFKVHDNNYLAGPVGEFLEVPEGGELKGDIPHDEHLPTRRLKTYGKQFTLTRQAFINDDIDLVTRIPARYAAAARKTINTQCYQILLGLMRDNAGNLLPIYDGKALFCAEHRNVTNSGTGITQEAMQGMIMGLSTQKDQFDQPIIIRPNALIVPVGMEFDMYTLFNSPYIETKDNTQAVNPLYRYQSLQVISDPTINALCGGFGHVMPWFLTGATEDTDFIEVDYLNGQEIPTIRRMETPGQLGFVWDIYLDWGINVMDYRGAIKNPGIAIADPLTIANG